MYLVLKEPYLAGVGTEGMSMLYFCHPQV